MVTLNKIYTKTGDDGSTMLGTGETRPKHDTRVSAYGTVDEANCIIGLARLHTTGEMDALLERVQNDLFDCGADLCTPPADDLPYEPLRISEKQVTRLENEIDAINAELEPLNSFVLPGGSPASAHLHLARTVVRRAERLVTQALAEGETIDKPVQLYLNRLSDLLFVAARAANENGRKDVLWTPGANR